MLPNDLRDYKADDPFQLIDDETAGWLLIAGLVVVVILDAIF